MELTVRLSRFDPSIDQTAYFQTFHLSVPLEEKWTALDILDYIHLHLDSSVSYHRHSTCNRGVCARCAVWINGRTGLLCEYIVPADGELVLEPIPWKTNVKDLVVR
jgi:succinate dehydrogenase/fumarate reductase-like Fe-S protein